MEFIRQVGLLELERVHAMRARYCRGSPSLVCGVAVGYGAASGVYGKGLLTQAYPQGTLRRQDAARGVDGGPEHADRRTDRPRSTS